MNGVYLRVNFEKMFRKLFFIKFFFINFLWFWHFSRIASKKSS